MRNDFLHSDHRSSGSCTFQGTSDPIRTSKQDKNDFIDNIENQFRSFEKDFFINYFRIEAINGSCIMDTENSIELIDLLKYWITNRNEEMKEISNKVAKDIHNDFNRFGERY